MVSSYFCKSSFSNKNRITPHFAYNFHSTIVQGAHDKTDEHHETEEAKGKIYSDEQLTDIVDYVLKQMDLNNDGYVDYAEYRKSEDAQISDDNKKP